MQADSVSIHAAEMSEAERGSDNDGGPSSRPAVSSPRLDSSTTKGKKRRKHVIESDSESSYSDSDEGTNSSNESESESSDEDSVGETRTVRSVVSETVSTEPS